MIRLSTCNKFSAQQKNFGFFVTYIFGGALRTLSGGFIGQVDQIAAVFLQDHVVETVCHVGPVEGAVDGAAWLLLRARRISHAVAMINAGHTR